MIAMPWTKRRSSPGRAGPGRRLDFTLIGPDVNLVSRIQAVDSLIDHPLPMSRRFAEPVDLYERLGPQPDLPPL